VTNPLALFCLLTRTGTLTPGASMPVLATPVRTAA